MAQVPVGRMPAIAEDRPWLKGARVFVQQTLWPGLEALDADYPGREKPDYRKRYLQAATFFGCFVAAVLGSAAIHPFLAFPVFLGGIISLFVIGALMGSGQPAEQVAKARAMEKRVVADIAGFLGFTYRPDATGEAAGDARADLRDAGVLPYEPEHCHWSEGLRVTGDGYAADVWDLVVSQYGPEVRDQNTPFEGMAVRIAPTRKQIAGNVVGIGRQTFFRRATGPVWIGSGERPEYEPVDLESLEFEQRFTVFATDQVGARYLLTPAFMARLVGMTEVVGCDAAHFVCVDSHLTLLFDTRSDPFEIGNGKTLCDAASVERVFAELSSILDLAEALNLDSRTRV
ncbi:DUF3137 domain-containing protein [Thalassobaculum litoreum]|uniref:DUF3137 domain-containing protein n=1 Tax=Thalassobaculum litoreum DSM 18839 TaxID=1123362 RepID=A0A8G2BG79_9PROT|nr:DUF3137 domain-containing protein [Thalassobaculum litoreum]SDF43884.1 Protein of unknown function [Thalassobaculum litoreum DSM 18839]